MENILKLVSDKAGINESKAKIAVDTVISFLKNKLPAGLGSQVESLLKGSVVTDNQDGKTKIVGGIKEKLGGIFSKS